VSQVADKPRTLRIGEVAREVGTTPRTIRYYEEIGLLPEAADRPSGGHRNYTAADVDRLRELIRLRDLLGVSLEELRELVEAEEARAVLRREFQASEDPVRRRDILHQALGHLDRQLELVRRRKAELERLEGELRSRRRRVRRRLAEGSPVSRS
jgi:MerR family transcriptional regulator, repressor of the yfmOP operon